MGMAATPRVATLDEYFALPEQNGPSHHELLAGEYVVSPPPTLRHQLMVLALYDRLRSALAGRTDLLVINVPGAVVLGDSSVVQPDVYVVARPASAELSWRDMALPVLAIEVLSSSTARYDRWIKRRLYQQAGVPAYWVVDLEAQLIECWRPEDQRPEIATETIDWRPDARGPDVAINVAELFTQFPAP
jgi:Uma2 family endonuclease